MNESGAQLLARLERPSLKDIDHRLFPDQRGPDHGEVVELYGPEGTAKTELLYHLVVRCVLSSSLGGLEVDVVFIDNDFNLDLVRLVSVLEDKIHTARGDSSSSSDSSEVLRECLSRLLVVQCTSSSQLLLTLHSLETSVSSRCRLALLLIDSVSAFYWLDRCEGGASVSKQEETLSKCSLLLARLLRDYRITVFATVHAIRRSSGTSSSSSSSSSDPRFYLCSSWQRLVSHRLLCSSSFSSAGGRQVYTVHCTSSSSSASSSRTKAYRSSSFYVTDGGLEFI